MLDTTNPGAQQYLRETYTTLAKEWGIRYIKLDFMDDSVIEGYYYLRIRPRFKLSALDCRSFVMPWEMAFCSIKMAVPCCFQWGSSIPDASPATPVIRLRPAGTRLPGIAARYYMNRNFFVSDPDAFSISRKPGQENSDHGGPKPLTLEEAQVAIALAAVSGGMFEIGDDLPTLFLDADRMALLQNRDLLNMARFGQAAKPLDLMSYAPEDEMPSIFLLRESNRQSILAVFNWTEKEREHDFSFSDLFPGQGPAAHNTLFDVFGSGAAIAASQASFLLKVPPHSVQMVKIIDTSIPASAPSLKVQAAEKIETGKPTTLSAQSAAGSVPALFYRWDFGDGTSAEGSSVTHSYTHAGSFTIHLIAEGIEGVPFEKSLTVSVIGTIDPIFRPDLYQRYMDER